MHNETRVALADGSGDAKVRACTIWAESGGAVSLKVLALLTGAPVPLVEDWIDEARHGSITVESRINSMETNDG